LIAINLYEHKGILMEKRIYCLVLMYAMCMPAFAIQDLDAQETQEPTLKLLNFKKTTSRNLK
jgi:hypothetical protein